jgi:hypothetical protein
MCRSGSLAVVAAHGTIASMSGKGDCYDNAVARSILSTRELALFIKNGSLTPARPAVDAIAFAHLCFATAWPNRRLLKQPGKDRLIAVDLPITLDKRLLMTVS